MTHAPSPVRWWVLANIVLMNFVVTGGGWNYVIMLVPQVVGDLGLELADWGALWAAIALGVLVCSIPAGVVGDRFGARIGVGSGVLVAALSLWLRAQAMGQLSMLAAMATFGLALALILANVPKALGEWFPVGELGLANGISQAGIGLGLGAATLVTPLVVDAAGGWRGLTAMLAAISAVAAVVWLLTVRDPEGAALRGAPVGLLGPIAVVIRVREVRLLALCYALYMAGYLGAIGVLPTYFTTAKGMAPETAGAIVALGPWSFIVGSLVLPVLSDRLGLRRSVYLPAMLTAGVALFAATWATSTSLGLAVVVLGFASGAVALLFVMPIELPEVGPELGGSAIGVITMAGFVGGAVSPLIGVPLVAASPVAGFGFFAVGFVSSSLLVLAIRETGSARSTAADSD